MKFLIICAFAWATVFGLPAEKIKSRNIVVPAGRPEGRMTHAFNASEGQFPYQVGIIKFYADDTMRWCSGSLISNTEVITAAHCIRNVLKVVVLLGTTNRDIAEVVYDVPVEDIVVHPGWKDGIPENDIAIIHIPYTLYSKNIQAVKLPATDSANSTFAGETAVATGWGRTSDSAKGPTMHLQFANFEVIPNSVCNQTFAIIHPSHICTATYNRVSPCRGDSGGPLVLEQSKTLIGLNSFISASGCELSKPVAYTRVTSYLDWIQQNSNFAP